MGAAAARLADNTTYTRVRVDVNHLTTLSDDGPKKAKSHIGWIVGLSVGGGLSFIAMIVFAVLYSRRKDTNENGESRFSQARVRAAYNSGGYMPVGSRVDSPSLSGDGTHLRLPRKKLRL